MNDRTTTHLSLMAADQDEDPPSTGPGDAARLEVSGDLSLLAPRLRKWLKDNGLRAVRAAAPQGGEVRLRLIGDAEMAALHERYSGIPGTTDVLTFDLRADEPGSCALPLDVDIVACVDEAARQAGARGIPVERELLLYLLHGALHCLGYDDHDEAGHAAMHAREDEILEAIGVGATFGGPAEGDA